MSCPNGSNCDLLSGRLAYVKTLMWCDNSESDDMFDQEMFYSYDEAGRITEHTVEDDGGRKGRVVYTYDDNSNVTRIDYPAGTSAGAVYTYGPNGTPPGDDRILEQGRPLAAWSWPTSGDATRIWEVDPGLFGWDEVTVGANIYQPIRFPGQLYDEDTEAWADDSGATLKRPGICYNRYRSYDSFTGGYLQVDPEVGDTWDAYEYARNNPVSDTALDGDGGSVCHLSLANVPPANFVTDPHRAPDALGLRIDPSDNRWDLHRFVGLDPADGHDDLEPPGNCEPSAIPLLSCCDADGDGDVEADDCWGNATALKDTVWDFLFPPLTGEAPGSGPRDCGADRANDNPACHLK